MEDILKAIPAWVEAIGIFQTMILILAGVFGLTMAKSMVTKNNSPKQAVADALTPMTCGWGDHEKTGLATMKTDVTEIRREVEKIGEKVIRIEDRLRG